MMPQELGRLFSDGSRSWVLDADLPPGRLIVPSGDDAPTGRPAYWLSDDPIDADLFERLRLAHARSGLWPVLADAMRGDPQLPWEAGAVSPQPVTRIDGLDADAVLAGLWADWIGDGEPGREHAELRPYGRAWPGLAPAAGGEPDPDVFAGRYVRDHDDGASRAMLVPAARSADVVTAIGWQGPLNHTEDMALLSAVLRSWETRFGARLIELGFDTLVLAVAAPPVTDEHAASVAAEHFAFCPDNIVQGAGTIAAYAAGLRGQHMWLFWWD